MYMYIIGINLGKDTKTGILIDFRIAVYSFDSCTTNFHNFE